MYVVDSLPPVEWLSSLEKINFISTLLFLLFWLIRGKFQPFKWGCLPERFSSVRNTGKSVLRGPGGWHGPGFPKKLGPAVQAIQKLLRCTKSHHHLPFRNSWIRAWLQALWQRTWEAYNVTQFNLLHDWDCLTDWAGPFFKLACCQGFVFLFQGYLHSFTPPSMALSHSYTLDLNYGIVAGLNQILGKIESFKKAASDVGISCHMLTYFTIFFFISYSCIVFICAIYVHFHIFIHSEVYN